MVNEFKIEGEPTKRFHLYCGEPVPMSDYFDTATEALKAYGDHKDLSEKLDDRFHDLPKITILDRHNEITIVQLRALASQE